MTRHRLLIKTDVWKDWPSPPKNWQIPIVITKAQIKRNPWEQMRVLQLIATTEEQVESNTWEERRMLWLILKTYPPWSMVMSVSQLQTHITWAREPGSVHSLLQRSDRDGLTNLLVVFCGRSYLCFDDICKPVSILYPKFAFLFIHNFVCLKFVCLKFFLYFSD